MHTTDGGKGSMPRTIAVANQKGGVGKTTTAINLAASLSQKGEKVLLVDSDPQGNASSGLGVRAPLKHQSLASLLLPEGPQASPLRPLAQIDLALIPSNPDLSAAEWNLHSQAEPEQALQRALQPIQNDYSYIIIDCPPSLGLLTIAGLIAAHSVLVPLQCEYFAMEGLTQLLETIRKVKLRWNPHLVLEGIVLTMFDRRNNLSHQVANEVRKHFDRVFATIIPRNVRITESPSHGLPVTLYDPHSPGANAFMALADEMLVKRKQS